MKAQFRSNKGFSDVAARDNQVDIKDLTDVLKWPDGEWVGMRFVGPNFAYAFHGFDTIKKDGSRGFFKKQCLRFDQDTRTIDTTKKCPYCEAVDERIKLSVEYYNNAIIRSLQENEPAKRSDPTSKEEKTGLKEKGSSTWTPIKAVRLTDSMAQTCKKLRDRNIATNKATSEKKAFDLNHKKFGRDIDIMYDPKEKSPGKKYSIQGGDRTPLTEDEEEYLCQPIEDLIQPESYEEARKELDGWLKRMDGKGGKKEEDGEDEDRPRKKKPANDDYADDDAPPTRRKASSDFDEDEPKPKKRARDEEEEDEPPPRKRPRDEEEDEPAPKRRRPDPEEEEEPPRKKRKPDPDEEDEPPPRRRRAEPEEEDEPKPKKRRPDPDEEDEPPPRKKRPPADEEFD